MDLSCSTVCLLHSMSVLLLFVSAFFKKGFRDVLSDLVWYVDR